jgi:hypothetical protein
MEKTNATRLLELADKILIKALEEIDRIGTYDDIEDMDGKGGTRTQRLNNCTGLGEIRLIRSMAAKELGMDQPTPSKPGTPQRLPLLSQLQAANFTLEQLHQIGTQDD